MGWDTQINIIIENVQNEALEIASYLYEADAKSYDHNGTATAKLRKVDEQRNVLFFTYERRKYLPYWMIQEASKKYVNKHFTVIASSPDFLGGPAGLVKIKDGEIIDSYGFWDRAREILKNPNAEVIYQLFGVGKLEDKFRQLYVDQQPKTWIDEIYDQNIIDFNLEQMEQFAEIIEQTKKFKCPG